MMDIVMRRRRWGGSMVVAGTLLVLVAGMLALLVNPADAQQGADKIWICHATPPNGGAPNKYEAIEIDDDGTYQGHEQHSNDLIPMPAAGCPDLSPPTTTTTTTTTVPQQSTTTTSTAPPVDSTTTTSTAPPVDSTTSTSTTEPQETVATSSTSTTIAPPATTPPTSIAPPEPPATTSPTVELPRTGGGAATFGWQVLLLGGLGIVLIGGGLWVIAAGRERYQAV